MHGSEARKPQGGFCVQIGDKLRVFDLTCARSSLSREWGGILERRTRVLELRLRRRLGLLSVGDQATPSSVGARLAGGLIECRSQTCRSKGRITGVTLIGVGKSFRPWNWILVGRFARPCPFPVG